MCNKVSGNLSAKFSKFNEFFSHSLQIIQRAFLIFRGKYYVFNFLHFEVAFSPGLSTKVSFFFLLNNGLILWFKLHFLLVRKLFSIPFFNNKILFFQKINQINFECKKGKIYNPQVTIHIKKNYWVQGYTTVIRRKIFDFCLWHISRHIRSLLDYTAEWLNEKIYKAHLIG